jgi:hypothetical protein
MNFEHILPGSAPHSTTGIELDPDPKNIFMALKYIFFYKFGLEWNAIKWPL